MTHLIATVSGGAWTAGCGEVSRSVAGRRPDGFTAWSSDVTCPACAARDRTAPQIAVSGPRSARAAGSAPDSTTGI